MKENIGHFGFQRTARDSFERVTLCRIVLWKWWQRYAFCEFLTTAKSKLRLLTEGNVLILFTRTRNVCTQEVGSIEKPFVSSSPELSAMHSFSLSYDLNTVGHGFLGHEFLFQPFTGTCGQ